MQVTRISEGLGRRGTGDSVNVELLFQVEILTSRETVTAEVRCFFTPRLKDSPRTTLRNHRTMKGRVSLWGQHWLACLACALPVCHTGRPAHSFPPVPSGSPAPWMPVCQLTPTLSPLGLVVAIVPVAGLEDGFYIFKELHFGGILGLKVFSRGLSAPGDLAGKVLRLHFLCPNPSGLKHCWRLGQPGIWSLYGRCSF